MFEHLLDRMPDLHLDGEPPATPVRVHQRGQAPSHRLQPRPTGRALTSGRRGRPGDDEERPVRAIPPSGDVPAHLHALGLAKAADDQGYDGIYVSDHMFFPRDRQSRYTYSTAEDGAPGFGDHWDPDTNGPTPGASSPPWRRSPTRVQFTTGVYVAPARDLITVAKQVGTAAVVSSDRVTLGVGVGWCEEEFEATGQDFHTRGKRLDDMIPALRALWAGGWVEYHGPHYDVPAMRMEPSPTGPIPIIGGGHSAPALRRAAALCDGWVAAGAYKPDEARALPRRARRGNVGGPGGRTSPSRSTCRCGPGPTSICTGASRRTTA